MRIAKPKPDIQVELYCPTCKRITKQAHIEGFDWCCTICVEVHTLDLPNTSETLKQMMEFMSDQQHLAKKIVGSR